LHVLGKKGDHGVGEVKAQDVLAKVYLMLCLDPTNFVKKPPKNFIFLKSRAYLFIVLDKPAKGRSSECDLFRIGGGSIYSQPYNSIIAVGRLIAHKLDQSTNNQLGGCLQMMATIGNTQPPNQPLSQ